MILPNYLCACLARFASTLKLVYILVFLGIVLTSTSAFSQCENSIKIEKIASDETGKGIIEVAITTTKAFVCVLHIQKGSGPQFVEQKKGNGSGTVQFSNLDKNAIYQVEIEFTSEEKPICRKLQKSLITFQ